MNIQNSHHNNKSGQVLLIVALVATIILTIGLSVSHISQQEIKIAKLEQDAKQAFTAAEAGAEAALRLTSGTLDISTLNLGQEISGQAIITFERFQTYNVPRLSKDEQYTFYLSDYTPKDPEDEDSQQQFGAPFFGTLSIGRLEPTAPDYCSTPITKFAVELTFINASTNTLVRRLIDECAIIQGSIIGKVAFDADIDVSAFPSHLLLLRIIAPDPNFSGAKLTVTNKFEQWYAQGKTITSTANISTGVTKKIKLFQSYPQIPSDFFVTSF